MNVLHNIFIAMSLALTALSSVSCAKMNDTGDGKLVKVFEVGHQNTTTRSNISGFNVNWSSGDKILYVTNDEDGYLSYTLYDNVSSVKVPVEYRNDDNMCVFFTAGANTSAVISSAKLSRIVIDNAIPASQDGSFGSYHISAATANLLSPSTVSLTPCQAYVKFRLSSLTVADKTVNKILISDNATTKADICGTMTISPGSTVGNIPTVEYSGTGDSFQTITIDKTGGAFIADTDYYIAMRPGTYSAGIKLTLMNSSTLLGTVTTNPFTLTTGGIVNLQALNGHKKVDATSLNIYPTYSAFTRVMTKELFVAIEPSDFTGSVNWESSNTDIIPISTAAENSNPKYLRDETKDGVIYKVYQVATADLSANADYTADKLSEVTLTCNLINQGESSPTRTVTTRVRVGLFVDLGIIDGNVHTLWGVGNMVGYETVPTTNTDIGDISAIRMFDPDNAEDLENSTNGNGTQKDKGIYSWGSCRRGGANHNNRYTNYNQWGGTFNPNSGNCGGKYNQSDGLERLQRVINESGYPAAAPYNRVDDPCSLWKGGVNGTPYVHVFSPADWSALCSAYYTTWEDEEEHYGYAHCRKVTSNVWGYEDMYIYIYAKGGYSVGSYSNSEEALMSCNRASGIARQWSAVSYFPSTKEKTAGGYKTNGFSIRPVMEVIVEE